MDKPVDLFARGPVGLLTGKLANLFPLSCRISETFTLEFIDKG